MIKVSKAEYDVLVAAYSHDGLKIAMLEAKLKQAKEDIKRLLVLGSDWNICQYCKNNSITSDCASNCENEAEWRGWKEDGQ